MTRRLFPIPSSTPSHRPRPVLTRAGTLAVLFLMLASVLPAQAAGNLSAPRPSDTSKGFKATVGHALRSDKSPKLRDIKVKAKKPTHVRELRLLQLHSHAIHGQATSPSATRAQGQRWTESKRRVSELSGTGAAPAAPALPASAPKPAMPALDVNFEGIGAIDGVLPPDTNGDVSPTQYVEWVNLSLEVFDKAGNSLMGPQPGNALWAGFGGICEFSNDGDPIVQYDHLADRWMVSQFALFGSDGNHQCIAISTTNDATGSWYRYDFLVSATKINDYPHFGVWPDAYYMTTNQFDAATFNYAGAGAVAFERPAMLAGSPDARMVYFDEAAANLSFGGQLPSDLDGAPPPDGTPNYFAEADDSAFGQFATDSLRIWEFHVDWSAPETSTFGLNGQPNLVLDTDPFDMNMCDFNRSCIDQPGTDQGLDAISDRLMYRLQYRNYGDHQTLVANHTVDADGNDRAGIRWYELTKSAGDWAIDQQGTYAPDDGNSRWMASAALDASGDLAIGYSVSGPDTFPSIRTAGRLVSDPPNTLPQTEREVIAGTGSQTFFDGRWGDYSMLAVDATDDCTYWYASEYLVQTSVADWHTRIASFKYPSCTTGPRGDLVGTVTESGSGNPIAGAEVDAGASTTFTNASGQYKITLPADTYEVSALAYGFGKVTVPGVVITDGGTTTQDFVLDPLPQVDVSGTVTDGDGHGYPLYARISVQGAPIPPIFTDPLTGGYHVTLFQQTAYTLHVRSLVVGYDPTDRPVEYASATATEDVALHVNATDCNAPGYVPHTDGLFEGFDTQQKPVGWLITSNIGGGTVWTFNDPNGHGNLTGGSGNFAIVDSDFAGPQNSQDTDLISPRVDLTGIAAPAISFNSDYFHFDVDIADVDLSLDNGDSWATVWHQDADRRGPRLESIPIPEAAGNPNVKVKFHYYNATFAWWWEIDNVVIGNRQCVPVAGGGLVVGNVSDGNTGDFVNGATVASDDAPADRATTAATPADPNVDDGFYVLFSSLTGSHPLTASAKNYNPDTQTTNVVLGGTVRQDFSLAAGRLTATPPTIEVTVPMGGTGDSTLTVGNDGTAPATFELGERDAGRDILTPVGARKTLVAGRYSPHRLPSGKSTGGGAGEEPTHPRAAPPWTAIADYPSPIMDNAVSEHDGLIYSVAGFDGNANLASGQVYDPGTNAWSPIATMSFIREKPAAAFVGDLLYVVGGWGDDGAPVATLEIYDPGTDSWSTGAEIPTAHAAATALSLDGQLYVIGGCDSFSCGSQDVFKYDPATDSWSTAASYPQPISWNACAPIDGLIYCAGGVSDAEGSQTTTWVYDPGTDSWSGLASLPQDQWGMGFTGAAGQLIISGGVTDQFNTLTNEGFAYDPGSDKWEPIPNSNNVVYRGGSACGFYKIGGSVGGFSPVPDSEVLPDLTDCGAGTDVTWLSEDPTSATLDPSGTQPIAVHFDATVPAIDQPGDYQAGLTFKEDTPYSVPAVSVTMHVTPPATWGKLDGTVEGLARCDAPGAALKGATVLAHGTTTDFTLKTDASGSFEIWMDAANGPVELTVSRDGYVAESRSNVAITAGGETTEAFSLRLDAPCVSATPGTIEISVPTGHSGSKTLDLGNAGAAGAAFSIVETFYDLTPSGPAAAHKPATFSTRPIAFGPASFQSTTRRPAGPIALPNLPPWLGGAPLPGGLVRYAHAQCDGDTNGFYVFGGVDGSFSTSKKAFRYDAAANAWTELATMPNGGEAPTAACYAGKIHVFGGDATNQHFIYDIATNTWSTGAPAPRNLAGAYAGGWNGRIYVAGGNPDFSFSGSTEVDVYDVATDSWLANGSPMPHGTSLGGSVQVNQYLYTTGGFDSGSPDVNVAATQRYDMSTDIWTTGPDLPNARADLALAATDTALYAIGGDASGGFIFEGTTEVTRLTTGDWGTSAWTSGHQLPIAITAASAGFCTEAITGGEVWTTGGLDATSFTITGYNQFDGTPGEHCPTIRSDVPWLSEAPTFGSLDPDSSSPIKVTVDASDLAVGSYTASLIIPNSDPAVPELHVPVHVTVTEHPTAEYISIQNAQTVGGVAADNEDILIVREDNAVFMHFDGSDVGIQGLAISSFSILADDSIVMSFTAPATVPGITGIVDDSDLVKFTPSSLGDTTAGTFSLYFDGSDVGLTTPGEAIDALDVLPNGHLIISTGGNVKVAGISAADADLLEFTPSSLGSTTAGTWSWYFDGSDVGLTTASEDVDAVAIGADGTIYVSTLGAMSVPGLNAANEDVAVFSPTQLGATTTGTWSSTLQLDGSVIGLGPNNVSGVDLP